MKVLLVTGGLGTRLRLLVDTVSKYLVAIGSQHDNPLTYRPVSDRYSFATAADLILDDQGARR